MTPLRLIFRRMKEVIVRLAAGLAIGGFLLAGSAAAQNPTPLIDNPGKWGAFTVKEKDGTACYLAGKPDDMAPDNVNRGPVWLLVTHRPHRQVSHEVSIYIGYPFKKDSTVTVDIDGKKLEMFTDGETAWARDAAADRILTQAMRDGLKLVVQGISSRGTNTTDQYSLKGFTRAHNAINDACGVKFSG